MNSLVVDRLAWTLLHFLWQGAAIAGVGMIASAVVGTSARRRYITFVTVLLLMSLAPIMTYAFLIGGRAPEVSALAQDSFTRAGTFLGDLQQPRVAETATNRLKWIVAVWLAGVLVSLVHLAMGWRLTVNLIRSSCEETPEHLRRSFDQLLNRFKISPTTRLLVSSRVTSPVVVGWLKPAVLLPLSVVSGLDPSQLEAILAHEIAHIRRHDFLVNLLQRSVESILFYHPAVWWVSRHIRIERELCCDDVAVSLCGDALLYARTLLDLEAMRSKTLALTISSDGNQLDLRVRRIVSGDRQLHHWKDGIVVLATLIVVLLLTFGQTEPVSARVITPAPTVAEVAVSSATALPSVSASVVLPTRTPSQRPSTGAIASPDDAFFLFTGDGLPFSGRGSDSPGQYAIDFDAARRTQQSAGGQPLLWFRLNSAQYILSDIGTLNDVLARVRSLEIIENDRRKLRVLMGQAAEERVLLDQEIQKEFIGNPDYRRDIEEISRLATRLRESSDRQELSALEKQLDDLKAWVLDLQGRAGKETFSLGLKQKGLQARQDDLTARQARIDEFHSVFVTDLEERIRAIMKQSSTSGLAIRIN
jgi:beta-lactamase regulating signal transducer with metallopeptidase domain